MHRSEQGMISSLTSGQGETRALLVLPRISERQPSLKPMRFGVRSVSLGVVELENLRYFHYMYLQDRI